jgi:CBS domain-containing protein
VAVAAGERAAVRLERSNDGENDTMLISEIMTRDVESIGPDDTLQEAAMRMKEFGVGPLPVCQNQSVVGMVTDRDITLRAVAKGLDPATTPVRDVMSEEIVCCFEDQNVELAARLMESKQIRRVLVVDRDKKLVGIITLADLSAEAVDTQRAGEILHEVSEAAPQA